MPKSTQRSAFVISIAILFSRIAGFIRDRVFAHYLGNTLEAGAFRAAMRIPNLLQNLFGEGALSASFIPVYSKLMAENKTKEAQDLSRQVFYLLFLVTLILSSLGVIFSKELIQILAPGFEAKAKELTIHMTQILFPAVGLLVLSAWCLGVLNSHRRFFLPYFAPVFWNLTIIATLFYFGSHSLDTEKSSEDLVIYVSWGVVLGSSLQFLIQLPLSLKLIRGLDFKFNGRLPSLKIVLFNFVPALISRGIVQFSAYIDQILASFLGPSTVAAMAYTQTLSLLPVSLFGTSVSSAELPEMSSIIGNRETIDTELKLRLKSSLNRIAFFVIPSSILFFTLGDIVVATLFQTGKFTAADTYFVRVLLAASCIGLLSSTQSRIINSVFWALQDTKTPLNYALIRVSLNTCFGFLALFVFRSYFELQIIACAALLSAFSGVASWCELFLLRRALQKRIGLFAYEFKNQLLITFLAFLSAVIPYFAKSFIPDTPLIRGALLLPLFLFTYFVLCLIYKIPEAKSTLTLIRTKLNR